jgi:hypothetical protein
MSLIRPNNNSEIIVDDFILYATTHLNTISGVANTISLYPPIGTPAPGVVLWSGYFVPPPSATIPTIEQPQVDIQSLYNQLDFSQIPLDINSVEVQEIINPSISNINQKIIADGDLGNDIELGSARISQLDNTVAEVLDRALYDQGIITDADSKLQSGYKNLDELLKIAGNLAPKLRKNPRVRYENLKSGYKKGIHGLCPQGTQAVVVALTGIMELGTISGNADWFSFKNPSTGGGRSSFAINIGGKTYYNDKVKVGNEYINNPSQWQVGDIIVNGYTGTKPYGHIQVWTGFKWVSDFTQNRIQINNVDFNTLALWRLNNNGKEVVLKQSS